MPSRIQLKRTAGWRMPAGCRKVDRSTRYGNPFQVWRSPSGAWAVRLSGGELLLSTPYREAAVQASVDLHSLLAVTSHVPRPALLRIMGKEYAAPAYPTMDEIIEDLAGADLGCWCPIPGPCHAATLLEVANREGR